MASSNRAGGVQVLGTSGSSHSVTVPRRALRASLLARSMVAEISPLMVRVSVGAGGRGGGATALGAFGARPWRTTTTGWGETGGVGGRTSASVTRVPGTIGTGRPSASSRGKATAGGGGGGG